MEKLNTIEQFGLSWISFKQSVLSRQRRQCVLWHRHFILKECHKINVLTCRLKSMCVVCTSPGSGETHDIMSIVIMVTCLGVCLVLSLKQLQNTVQARFALLQPHIYSTVYVSCKVFHNGKNISQVSINHLMQGVSLRSVAGKIVLYPSSRDHRNAVGAIPDEPGCRTFRQTDT